MPNESTTTSVTEIPPAVSAADMVAKIVDVAEAFAGTRDQFIVQMLAGLNDLCDAKCGAILRVEQSDAVQMMGIYPPLEQDNVAPQWLSQAADFVPHVLESKQSQIIQQARPDDFYGQEGNEFIIIVPVGKHEGKAEVGVFHFRNINEKRAVRARYQLEFITRLLSVFDMRKALKGRTKNLARMRSAMEITAQVGEHIKFRSAAMALCNEVAAKWSAERVSLGTIKGRYVKLRAISHTDKFTRKMRLVQDIEGAMEECFDQDVEVVYPAETEAPYVSRAASEVSNQHGPTCIASFPLRRDDKVEAVMLIERDPRRPFQVEELETMRLLCDLAAGPLLYLNDHDKWLGAKAASDARSGLKHVFGPKHTWLKLLVIGVTAAIILSIALKGTFKVDAPFVIESPELRLVSAPYTARLKSVHVEPTDEIVAGETLLAEFDDSMLRLQLAEALASKVESEKQRNKARDERNDSEVAMAQAKIDRAQAEIDLLEAQIAKARIVAPIDGMVLSGELKKQLNAEFQMGDPMFELAPANAYRAELSMPENRMGDINKRLKDLRAEMAAELKDAPLDTLRAEAKANGVTIPEGETDKSAIIAAITAKAVKLRGELTTTADPGTHYPFEIERINPVAEVVDGRNVFNVRARLLTDDLSPDKVEVLKRGMKGTAQVALDERPYIDIWTHDLRNWLKMKLWSWGIG